ncbi:DUF4249 domain-containing protein [Thermophagus sp. OGC60D27]|uniref:DUF4249 domain-containing protein n=1 Tax=Thermophagus sp. OGC60D27 TaxID=3458415 RepID=UPI0040383A1C
MTPNRVVYILTIVGMLFFGCEKSLKVELEEKGGNLVLFSFLNPDSAFNVHLSKSVSFFSIDDFERVYDGNITVYKNGKLVDDFIFPFDQTWAYREDIGISYGDTFRIDAYDSKGNKASGETVVPHPVSMVIKDTLKVVKNDLGLGLDSLLECHLIIPDPKAVSNYYQLLVFEEICSIGQNDTICKRNRIDYSKVDKVFYVRDQEGSLIGGLDFEGCFSDYLFNGEDYELILYIPNQYILPTDSPNSKRRIVFMLLSHTRQYFDYFRSRIIAEFGYDLPLLDPILIFNNVEGGLGVISAYSISSCSLDLP